MVRYAATGLLVACVLLAGCGGATTLLGASQSTAPSTIPAAPQTGSYLAQLSSEQARLAAAERRIPHRPRTQRQLAHAIGLLQRAIARLSLGLAALSPPRSVSALHTRLVGVARAYARRLSRAASIATRPAGELQAVELLSGATDRATRAFASTVALIDRTLAR